MIPVFQTPGVHPGTAGFPRDGGRSKIVSSTIYCASLYITSHKVNLSLTKLPITLLQKRWTFEHVGRGKSWIFYFSCVKKPLESQKG